VSINDKLSQTYLRILSHFFRTRIIRILPSKIKYVLIRTVALWWSVHGVAAAGRDTANVTKILNFGAPTPISGTDSGIILFFLLELYVFS